ncbi:MAG: cyclic pyranopterin monophosphate synthase MoaC [Candidatus Brockarchaeota archaeon]|nr:cyclic pyranopterin monophosphate synthase MoaC [Candidatus Brockarchaeota archaeon]
MKVIDISGKEVSRRECTASGEIRLKEETIRMIKQGLVPKGDVLSVARVSAALAVKKTSELIPACHNVPIEGVELDYELLNDRIVVTCRVVSESKTGVEMEALTGTCVALLTLWDMVKELEKDEMGQYPTTELLRVRVLKKVKE